VGLAVPAAFPFSLHAAMATAMNQRIFVLEDQLEIGRIVCRALEEHGYEAELFTRAADFFRRFRARLPQLCIIDLTLPDEDGLNVIRDMQRRHHVPVIIMTGRSAVVDRVLGLELGADDYVTKPFDPREMVARVNAVLRRAERQLASGGGKGGAIATFGEWSFDFEAHTLTRADGTKSELSAAEARLLDAFVRAPNRILSRDSFLSLEGSEDRGPFDRTIDVRVSRLRQKIEADPKDPQIIKTVYGAGYMFIARIEWTARDEPGS